MRQWSDGGPLARKVLAIGVEKNRSNPEPPSLLQAAVHAPIEASPQPHQRKQWAVSRARGCSSFQHSGTRNRIVEVGECEKKRLNA